MSYVNSEAQNLVHAVALNRLHSRRADHAVLPPPVATPADFADTVPLWFRSEAFAEDVIEAASGAVAANTRASAGRRQRIDVQVIAAGAAVLRVTMQALQLQRRG